VTENETKRHNVVSEGQEDKKIKISQLALKETKRHNRAGEKLSILNLQETKRHNIAGESLGRAQLSEAHRHNVAAESISSYQAQTQRMSAEAEIAYKEIQTLISKKDLSFYELNHLLNSKNAFAQALGAAGYTQREADDFLKPFFNKDGTVNKKNVTSLGQKLKNGLVTAGLYLFSKAYANKLVKDGKAEWTYSNGKKELYVYSEDYLKRHGKK
jgi:hypothetical protein